MKVIRIVIFVLAFLTWLFLTWSLESSNLVIGALVGIFISFTTSDMFPNKPEIFKRLGRYLWFFYYIPLFLWECFKANLDGAYRVLHPGLPINPGIVKVKTTLRSETGLTFLTNSLTLKPGTMTVDIDKENGFLYIHWVDVKSQDIDVATQMIVSKFEKVLKRIFE
jgi:multicomponent Na+:H+ antiporter subunit E